MSKIISQITSIEFKLVKSWAPGDHHHPFQVTGYEFISMIANQDVSVELTPTESKSMKRIVNVRLKSYDEELLIELFKKISKQIDITTHE